MMSLATSRILLRTQCTSQWSKTSPPCCQSWPRIIARLKGKNVKIGLGITCPSSAPTQESTFTNYINWILNSLGMTQVTPYAKMRRALSDWWAIITFVLMLQGNLILWLSNSLWLTLDFVTQIPFRHQSIDPNQKRINVH